VFIAELKPEQNPRPGYAILTIRKWEGESHVSLSIERNQDRCFLNDRGQWVGNVFQHGLNLTEEGDDYRILLDKSFVDALVENQQMAYRLVLEDENGEKDRGTLSIKPGVLSSLAEGHRESLKSSAAFVANTPEPVAEPEPEMTPEPQPILEPQPLVEPEPIAQPEPKKSKTGLIAFLLLVLAIIGVLIWIFLLKDKAPDVLPPAQVEVVEVPGECSLEKMKSSSGLDFVKYCLQTQPSGAEILSIIHLAKENKQCDVAQRLYAYKSQSGDTTIALQYAREYDPETAIKNGCFVADKETAMYWYEMITNSDPQNKVARERLAELKK